VLAVLAVATVILEMVFLAEEIVMVAVGPEMAAATVVLLATLVVAVLVDIATLVEIQILLLLAVVVEVLVVGIIHQLMALELVAELEFMGSALTTQHKQDGLIPQAQNP
jgi:hypothetical protein